MLDSAPSLFEGLIVSFLFGPLLFSPTPSFLVPQKATFSHFPLKKAIWGQLIVFCLLLLMLFLSLLFLLVLLLRLLLVSLSYYCPLVVVLFSCVASSCYSRVVFHLHLSFFFLVLSSSFLLLILVLSCSFFFFLMFLLLVLRI